MDTMKLNLKTRLMRGFIASVLRKKISKALGCDISILINDINIEVSEADGCRIHLDVDGEMERDSFVSMLKNIDSKG